MQLAVVNHLAGRVQAWDAALAGRAEEANERLELAALYLRALKDWDHSHAGPAYQNLAAPMLSGMAWHTERIRRAVEA